MHSTEFLHDLAVVMIVAGLVTILFHRLKQPVVLGYILAGIIIGPHTPPFPLISDEATIKTLSELGIIFLMFSLGLEFSLRKLKKVGLTAFVAASLEILLMIWIGYELGRAFGWKAMDCLFLGAMLSISSTTIIIKALGEMGLNKEAFAELIFGILIVEDILAIVLIALLSGIAMTGNLEARQLFTTVGKLGVFLVVALVAGLLTVPRLLDYVARFKSNEMLLVTGLGLCFGVSLLAVKLQYSVALGAFVIGAVVAETRQAGRIEHLIEPIKDMFSAVFFVAVGLLIEPKMLVEYALPIVAITVAVVVGKVVTCAFGTFVAGNNTRTSLRVGMGLAQIGEFSFIIASLGLSLKVTSGFLYPIAVTVSAITTLITPYLIKSADGLVARFDRTAPKRLLNYLTLYTEWADNWRGNRHQTLAGKLIRRWSWQIALNLILVAGVFILGAFVGRKPPQWLAGAGILGNLKAILWLGAMLLSLPLLIATFRKLQALGMLVGEMSVQRFGGDSRARATQAIIANTLLIAGSVAVSLYLLLLSSAVLPSGKELILLSLIVIGVAFLLRREFVRLYSKAQFSLEETLSQPPAPRHAEPVVPVLGPLKEVQTERIPIRETSQAAGMLIRQLALRTQTGASVIVIDRAGTPIVNPGPDEEILAGDELLLLGSEQQLDGARKFFDQPPASTNGVH